jgi:transposase
MGKVFVGIDVSKDRLDVAIRPSGEVFAVERNAAGLEALIARLMPLSPHLVAMEATGGFETIVAAALAAAGLPVVVVNPAQVRAFARGAWQAGENRPDRCGSHRPFRRGDRARPASASR